MDNTTTNQLQMPGPARPNAFFEDGKECPICRDTLSENNLAVTDCGHLFCHLCITTHFSGTAALQPQPSYNETTTVSCPICRHRFDCRSLPHWAYYHRVHFDPRTGEAYDPRPSPDRFRYDPFLLAALEQEGADNNHHHHEQQQPTAAAADPGSRAQRERDRRARAQAAAAAAEDLDGTRAWVRRHLQLHQERVEREREQLQHRRQLRELRELLRGSGDGVRDEEDEDYDGDGEDGDGDDLLGRRAAAAAAAAAEREEDQEEEDEERMEISLEWVWERHALHVRHRVYELAAEQRWREKQRRSGGGGGYWREAWRRTIERRRRLVRGQGRGRGRAAAVAAAAAAVADGGRVAGDEGDGPYAPVGVVGYDAGTFTYTVRWKSVRSGRRFDMQVWKHGVTKALLKRFWENGAV